jgi:hypothetical protein
VYGKAKPDKINKEKERELKQKEQQAKLKQQNIKLEKEKNLKIDKRKLKEEIKLEKEQAKLEQRLQKEAIKATPVNEDKAIKEATINSEINKATSEQLAKEKLNAVHQDNKGNSKIDLNKNEANEKDLNNNHQSTQFGENKKLDHSQFNSDSNQKGQKLNLDDVTINSQKTEINIPPRPEHNLNHAIGDKNYSEQIKNNNGSAQFNSANNPDANLNKTDNLTPDKTIANGNDLHQSNQTEPNLSFAQQLKQENKNESPINNYQFNQSASEQNNIPNSQGDQSKNTAKLEETKINLTEIKHDHEINYQDAKLNHSNEKEQTEIIIERQNITNNNFGDQANSINDGNRNNNSEANIHPDQKLEKEIITEQLNSNSQYKSSQEYQFNSNSYFTKDDNEKKIIIEEEKTAIDVENTAKLNEKTINLNSELNNANNKADSDKLINEETKIEQIHNSINSFVNAKLNSNANQNINSVNNTNLNSTSKENDVNKNNANLHSENNYRSQRTEIKFETPNPAYHETAPDNLINKNNSPKELNAPSYEIPKEMKVNINNDQPIKVLVEFSQTDLLNSVLNNHYRVNVENSQPLAPIVSQVASNSAVNPAQVYAQPQAIHETATPAEATSGKTKGEATLEYERYIPAPKNLKPATEQNNTTSSASVQTPSVAPSSAPSSATESTTATPSKPVEAKAPEVKTPEINVPPVVFSIEESSFNNLIAYIIINQDKKNTKVVNELYDMVYQLYPKTRKGAKLIQSLASFDPKMRNMLIYIEIENLIKEVRRSI